MSELTKCNFCSLEAIHRKARHNRYEVTVIEATPHRENLGGFDVYVHPTWRNVREMSHKTRRMYWECWFKELSDHCVC